MPDFNDIAFTLGLLISVIIIFAVILALIIKIKSRKKVKEIENYGKPSELRLKEILESEFNKTSVFTGVYIPYIHADKERYAEMDAVVVTSRGVFVIELKSHNGKITNRDAKYWTQVYNDKRITFYNPMYQNDSHVKVIRTILVNEGQYNVPIYSVVVFSSKRVTFTNEYPNLIGLDELASYMKRTGKSEAISTSQRTRIKGIIHSYLRSGKTVEQKHKKFVRRKRNYPKRQNHNRH